MLGIEVGFNWSLIFIFAYVAWTLATAYLPDAAPGHGVVVYWVAAAIGAALFYGSLLAHELSHAVVARSHGVKVAGITLWLFGGVSRLEGEPTSARSEALIAGVGPLTSFAVAVVARSTSCPRFRSTGEGCSARSSGGAPAAGSAGCTTRSGWAEFSPT